MARASRNCRLLPYSLGLVWLWITNIVILLGAAGLPVGSLQEALEGVYVDLAPIALERMSPARVASRKTRPPRSSTRNPFASAASWSRRSPATSSARC